MSRRIFLSYGHDDSITLARRLKSDLEARGHEVWIDEERLLPGEDWEHAIERGIEWACGQGDSGRVVFLMTPHAVRRPNGYCLNELSRAVRRGLPIVPVMVVWCEPPLSIDRIQWLDFRDCFAPESQAATYQEKFQRLAGAIEGDKVNIEGAQSVLLRVLQPLSFEADINQHLSRFTGRQWLFDEIDAWLAKRDAERVFWITGQPGLGKTALAAKLAWTRPEIAAVHFCRFGHAQKADPKRCVTSIAYQLATQLPEYAERLSPLPIKQIIEESNATTLFDRLIVHPLSENFTDPGRTVVVLIDALDEATQDGENQLASFLAAEFDKTPPWLRLIITSRPDPEVMFPLQRFTTYALDASSDRTRDDIRAFLHRELKAHLLDVRNADKVVGDIAASSEGSFLYAEWVRQEVTAGRLGLSEVDKFPKGLGGIYSQFAARQWPDVAAFKRDIAPALDVIAAARVPQSVAGLRQMFGWTQRQEYEFEGACGSLFTQTEDGFRPFHKSFLDWLTDPKRAGRYFIDEESGHALLAEFGMRFVLKPERPLHSVVPRHLPLHAAKAGRMEELARALSDPGLLRRELSVGSGAHEEIRRKPRHWLRDFVKDMAAVWPRELDSSALWKLVETMNDFAWQALATKYIPHLVVVWDDMNRPMPVPPSLGSVGEGVALYFEWLEGMLLLSTTIDMAREVAAVRPERVPDMARMIDAKVLKFIEVDAEAVSDSLRAARETTVDRNISVLRSAADEAYKRFKGDVRVAEWSRMWARFLER